MQMFLSLLLLALILCHTAASIPFGHEGYPDSSQECSSKILHLQQRDRIRDAFVKERVVPDLIPWIDPRMLVGVSFGNVSAQLGAILPTNATMEEPEFDLSSLQRQPIDETNYTIMFLDADNPETWKIPTLFYLSVDYNPACFSTATEPTVLVPWTYAPDPLGKAPHRYVTLVYRQSQTPKFQVGPGVSGRYTFPLAEFVKDNGLELVGGNFFKENGLG